MERACDELPTRLVRHPAKLGGFFTLFEDSCMNINGMSYLKLVVFAIALFFSTSTFASERNILDKRFKAYWSVFSSGQFDSAAQFIYPKDMELVRTEFVPIFLNAAMSSNSSVKKQADIFFEGIPTERRSALSAADSYIGLNRVGFAPSPQLLTMMKGSTVHVKDVQFTFSDEATILYTVNFLNGNKGDDQERFIKVDGVWFLRLKQIVENASKTKIALTK